MPNLQRPTYITSAIRKLVVVLVLLPAVARAEVEIVTGQIPPYSFEEDGKPAGVAVEIVQALAAIVGHSGKMTFVPWKRAVAMAERSADAPRLILPLNRSPERESRFTWVVPLLTDATALITRKDGKPRIATYQEARGYSVGVLLGSPLETELRNKGFRRVDVGVDEETNARKLQLGRIDAWFVASMVAPFVYKRLGFQPSDLVYGAELQVNDLHLGATKSLSEAETKAWQSAMEKILRNGTYDQILKKYRQR